MCLVLMIISIGLNGENREVKQKVHFCARLLWHHLQRPSPELCHFSLRPATVSSLTLSQELV